MSTIGRQSRRSSRRVPLHHNDDRVETLPAISATVSHGKYVEYCGFTTRKRSVSRRSLYSRLTDLTLGHDTTSLTFPNTPLSLSCVSKHLALRRRCSCLINLLGHIACLLIHSELLNSCLAYQDVCISVYAWTSCMTTHDRIMSLAPICSCVYWLQFRMDRWPFP